MDRELLKKKHTHTHCSPWYFIYLNGNHPAACWWSCQTKGKKCKLAKHVCAVQYLWRASGAEAFRVQGVSLLRLGWVASMETGSVEEEEKNKNDANNMWKTETRIRLRIWLKHCASLFMCLSLPSPILSVLGCVHVREHAGAFHTLRSTRHSCHVKTVYLQICWFSALAFLKFVWSATGWLASTLLQINSERLSSKEQPWHFADVCAGVCLWQRPGCETAWGLGGWVGWGRWTSLPSQVVSHGCFQLHK